MVFVEPIIIINRGTTVLLNTDDINKKNFLISGNYDYLSYRLKQYYKNVRGPHKTHRRAVCGTAAAG
jgi:hypothetical protein